MRTSVAASLVRNDRGRLRVGALRVQIHPEVDEADQGRIERCLSLFEDYCVVTQSVRAGVDVSVEVKATVETASGQS
jgi:organic hydroperoxide reductase OsmC/OhrA